MNSKELLEQLLQLTIWLDIKGYENYQISICGSVRNVKTKRILIPIINTHGYYYVNLYINNKPKHEHIHRLVAIHFIPNIGNAKCIDHKNNNRLDNTVSNLRWCTQQQNCFNSSIRNNNTSGTKGVNWHKKSNKWRAEIRFNKKYIYLGCYDDINDAISTRQKKALEIFGEYINECEL